MVEEVVEKMAKALFELHSKREHLNYGFGKSKREVVDLKQAVEVVVVGVWLKNLKKKCKRKVKKWMKKRTIATKTVRTFFPEAWVFRWTLFWEMRKRSICLRLAKLGFLSFLLTVRTE